LLFSYFVDFQNGRSDEAMTLKIDKLKIFFRSRSRSLNGDSASQLGESSSSYPEAISVTIPEGDSQAAVLSQGKVQKKTCTQDTRLPGGVATASSRQMNDKMWAEAHSHLSEKEQEVIARLLAADKSVSDWTPENLLWDIQAKREICDKKRWTFKCGDHTIQLRDTADKVLDWLDKFKAAGDIVSNVDPLHAGVPWAGIRFLIQVLAPLPYAFHSLTRRRWFNQSGTRWKLFSVASIGSAISSTDADCMKVSSNQARARPKHAKTFNWL
jgi:hypothetical protein